MRRRRLDRLHPYCRIASHWAESSDKGNSIQHFRRKSGTRNGFERRVCLPQRGFCQQTLQVGTGLTSTSPRVALTSIGFLGEREGKTRSNCYAHEEMNTNLISK